ncbi:MAG: SUMF1/EgtB/PvdO family nonheme iron enzyme [Hyphomicrobiaceae bacterium]
MMRAQIFKTLVTALVLFTSLLASAPQTQAKKLVALTIGNNTYASPQVSKLDRAINDARAVASLLSSELAFKDGIDVTAPVQARANQSRSEILRLWSKALNQLEPDDVIVFFYAGHGTAHLGENYLLPTDIRELPAGTDADLISDTLSAQAVPLSTLLARFNRRRAALKRGKGRTGKRGGIYGIFIIDACRNPIAENHRRFLRLPTGLSPVPAHGGSFILYSAAAGQTALDHLGPNDPHTHNSVFTRELVRHLRRNKNGSLSELAKDLKTLVYKKALANKDKNGQDAPHDQTPAYFDGFLRRTTITGDELQSAQLTPRQQRLARIVVTSTQERSLIRDTRSLQKQRAAGSAGAGSQFSPPNKQLRDCDKCPELIIVTGRPFTIGSPPTEPGRLPYEAQAAVTGDHDFAIGKFEVTVGEWRACAAQGACPAIAMPAPRQNSRTQLVHKSDQLPLTNVSFSQAQAYVRWLRKVTKKPYRLPSEAEWEFAARSAAVAGDYLKPYSFGSSAKAVCTYANGADRSLKSWLLDVNRSCADGYAHQAPVGTFLANAFGIHDMHGNVKEWVADCWHGSHHGIGGWQARSGSDTCQRVVRGGSWQSTLPALRTAWRSRYLPSIAKRSLGFRVARDVIAETKSADRQ